MKRVMRKCSHCQHPVFLLPGEKTRELCFCCEHQIPLPLGGEVATGVEGAKGEGKAEKEEGE